MKISILQPKAGLASAAPSPRGGIGVFPHASRITRHSAFTMIEIAICLAIIGIALVGIIGVLPYGMNTQRANREETVVGQDANLLIELIRNGSRGADTLTNYVLDISNTVTFYNGLGVAAQTHHYDFTPTGSTEDGSPISSLNNINNGTNIIGLMSVPEFYTNVFGQPGVYHAIPNVYQGGYSNHIIVSLRAISGLAADQPPQDNSIMIGDAFTYRLYVANASIAQDTNTLNQPYNQNLGQTLHDLRLTFLWPLLPSGKVGSGHLTFRTSIAGDLRQDPLVSNGVFPTGRFFYGPQTLTASP